MLMAGSFVTTFPVVTKEQAQVYCLQCSVTYRMTLPTGTKRLQSFSNAYPCQFSEKSIKVSSGIWVLIMGRRFWRWPHKTSQIRIWYQRFRVVFLFSSFQTSFNLRQRAKPNNPTAQQTRESYHRAIKCSL